jgi:putative PIN family toxin of toxin-antitoxin system
MSRLFIDSNILISAIVFDRNELEVFTKANERNDTIFISEHILEESTRVILKKFPEYLENFNSFIETSNITVIKKKEYMIMIQDYSDVRDKYDAHVIACAKTGECNFIITGDQDLLSYESKEIEIIKSKTYLIK